MAISVVQTKSASTLTVTLSSPTTAGNCLVVCVASFNTTTPASISGITLGGSADNFAAAVSNTAQQASAFIWCDPNCAGGQTSVVISGSNLSVASGNGGVVVYEVSGLAPSSVVDKVSSSSAVSGTSWTSGTTGTTTQASEFWAGVADSFNPSTPAGWTNTTVGTGCIAGQRIVSATGTATYNGTQSNTTWAACVATFKGTTNVSVSLPVAQVTVAAPAPGIQRGWTLALPVAQVTVSARPPAPSVNVAVALTPAQVNIAALPPKVARQLLISLASASGTDDYGTAFPQGILATAGVIEGPVLVGSDAFFYDPSPGSGNLAQSITEASGTDQYGNAYIAGTATYADNGSFWSAIVVDGGVVTWYMATGPGGPWTSEAGIGFSWNSSTGGGLEFTAPAGSDMTGDLDVSGSVTVTTTLTVAGTDVGATLSAIHAALSGASTSTDGLPNGTITGTSGGASAGTAHTHGGGSYSVTNGQHSHTLPAF